MKAERTAGENYKCFRPACYFYGVEVSPGHVCDFKRKRHLEMKDRHGNVAFGSNGDFLFEKHRWRFKKPQLEEE